MGELIGFKSRQASEKGKTVENTIDNREHINEVCRIFELLTDYEPKASKGYEIEKILKARELFKKSPDKAIESLVEFASKNRVSSDIIKEIAQMYIDKERNSKISVGKELLEKVADSKYCDAETLQMLADYYKYYGRNPKKEEECLDRLLELEPQNITALCMKAELQFNQNINESLKLVNKANDIACKKAADDETMGYIKDLLIMIYDTFDDYDNVLKIVEEKEEYKTDETQVYLIIANVYIKLRDYKKGIEYLEKARENAKVVEKNERKGPGHKDEFVDFDSSELINLADLYIREKRFKDAKDCIDEAFKFVDKKKDSTIYANLIIRKRRIEANL